MQNTTTKVIIFVLTEVAYRWHTNAKSNTSITDVFVITFIIFGTF